MSPTLIRAENEEAFTPSAPVATPTSEEVALVRTAGHRELPAGAAGVWECTPGRFRRQVAQAEYSYFISGEGTFTPDGGAPIDFRAGDAMYFDANTLGEWNLKETVRKAYILLASS